MSELTKTPLTDVVKLNVFFNRRQQRFVAKPEQMLPLLRYLEKNDFISIKSLPITKALRKSISWEKLAKHRLKTLPRGAIALRGSRVKENMTQQQLARLIKTEQANISKMEQGKRPIGKVIAHRLAKVLHVDYRLFL